MTRKEYEDALYREALAAEGPKGEYRKEALVPIRESAWKQMAKVSRDDLLAWALLESDERNLAYIRRRLELWEARPECRTLAELEAVLKRP